MKNKVVLITGGSSGIGKSVGEFLTEKGYLVYGTSRNPENISNHPFRLIALDVNHKETILKAVHDIIAAEGRIDILINNAGMGITGAIEETPTDEMRNVFETNFFGAIEMMKAVLPQMRKQHSGLIINVTSIAGYMGLPFRGIYSATKGALEIVTEAIRMEVKDFGIEVTNVAPGDFATNIASGKTYDPHWSVGIISVLVTVVIIILGIKKIKDLNGGFLSLSEALKTGLGIALISGLISVVYMLIFSNFIEPEYFARMMEVQQQKMLQIPTVNRSLT